jgi:endogenous inhibitor of DNA gyrase (YacG/DUF329 family)
MPLKLEPGKYYFTVLCSKCGDQIPVKEAPTPADEPTPTYTTISVKCPTCEHTDSYAPALISREQVPK